MPLDCFLRAIKEQCRPVAAQDDVWLVFTDESNGQLDEVEVPNSFHQVAVNLILNAIQHTRIFRNDCRLVQVITSVKDDKWPVIRIVDNGYGIPWESRERMFDMYFTTRSDGSGLGLNVSRRIVESSGGRLKCEASHKFLGTTMMVRLPGEIE